VDKSEASGTTTPNNAPSPSPEVGGPAAALKFLVNAPRTVVRTAQAGAYWQSVMSGMMGEVEKVYQLRFCAEVHQSKRLKILVSYFRDFPEAADHSDWTEREILKMWRMGNTDSLAALSQIVSCRRKPLPARIRMKQAMRDARLALYTRVYTDLTGEFGKIKRWINGQRKESPRIIKRRELWIEWRKVVPDEKRPPIDENHFSKLASTLERDRHYTPAYVARSYLRILLDLPDRVVSRIRDQPTLVGTRIQLYDIPPKLTD
jgi:hypothetical protein